MKKSKASRAVANKARASAAGKSATLTTDLKPLKPRPMLFRLLGLFVVLWIALLLTIYFTTVYPARHSAPGAPSVNDLSRP
jgi:hypothetical protein